MGKTNETAETGPDETADPAFEADTDVDPDAAEDAGTDGDGTEPQVGPTEDPFQDPKALKRLAEDLAALANINRLELLHVLTRPKYGEEIADAIGMSRQSALKHIQKLEERGFVRMIHGRRETGPVNEYQVVPHRLFALSVALGRMGELEPEGGPTGQRADETISDLGDPAGASERGGAIGSNAGHNASPNDERQLLILQGRSAGTRVPLVGDGSRWTLGRAEDRDVELAHDPFISAHHAEVHVGPKGHAIVDAYSANGTYLNFKRLPRGGRAPLKPGDVVGLGHTHIIYQEAEHIDAPAGRPDAGDDGADRSPRPGAGRPGEDRRDPTDVLQERLMASRHARQRSQRET